MAWERCLSGAGWALPGGDLPVIGADLAYQGDDYAAFHVRWGTHSMHHERHNGWLEDRIAGRLKQLCGEWAGRYNAMHVPGGRAPTRPEQIPVHYDADGRGGGLASHKGAFSFIGVRASSAAREPLKYPNRRSELWFATVRQARQGLVDLGRLDRETQARLRQEAMAPRWKVNASGQCEVERKDETKKRLKRSPDEMDALNLAYLASQAWQPPSTIEDPPMPPPQPTTGYSDRYNGSSGRRGGRRLYGG